MNIAIFTNNYLPNPYGVTGSIESFRREFLRRGHSVYIFAPRYKGYIDNNPNVFRYPSVNFTSNGINYPLGIPISKRIDKILRKLNINIVHSQHPNLLGWAAKRWAKKKKIPLVFTWHTLYDHYAHFAKFIPEKIAAGYMIKKAVKFANLSDMVVVPTDSIIPIIQNWGVVNGNVTPVATGVDGEEFGGADRNIIRKKYGIAENEIILLLVSRLTNEKNIEFVFRSTAEVLKHNNQAKFLVAGSGYLEPRLKNFAEKEGISSKVMFVGEIKRTEIKNYYAAGDIFVYGSKSETQGMVISEAMYMGLPIVAINATGIKSLVINNGNGFLVSENEKKFIEAVQKLIDNKQLREKFSQNSRKIAVAQFTSSVCAEKLLKVYEKAIKNHSK